MKELFTAFLVTIFCIFVILSGYGSVQLYERADRLDLIESHQKEMATLKDKLYWSEQANEFSLVLPKILNPRERYELAAENAVLQQKIIREYERLSSFNK